MKFVLLILISIAGIAKAIMDTLQFHFSESIFKNLNAQFLNPAISWKNKYDTWIPDTFTDGWHISQSIFLTCLFASVVFYRKTLIKSKYKWVSNIVVDFVIIRLVFGLTFILFYNYLLIRK